MMKIIAVVLDSVAQAAGMAPHLLTVARPGTEIVFLIPTKTCKPAWLLQARMAALLAENSLAVEVCEKQQQFNINQEKRAAEQQLKALRCALSKQGTETEIWIYTSSLRKALKLMERNYPGSFAVLRPRKHWLGEQLARAILTRLGVSFTNSVSRAPLASMTDARRVRGQQS